MLHLERLDPAHHDAAALGSFPDRVLFQTAPWLSFLAATQRGEVVRAAVTDGQATVGYFTGMVVQRYGFRILGSPLPGWTTPYIGFNLADGVPRRAALEALLPFAFRTLRCSHVEVRDRYLTASDLDGLGLRWAPAVTQLIDLRPDEDTLFARMDQACRWSVRKARKLGVVIEEASDPGFADDFYAQLREVFGRQGLVPTYGIDRVRALVEHLGPTGNLLLLRARAADDGRCVATLVCPWSDQTMYVWGGASHRADQRLRANEALVWHAIRYAKSRGLTELDCVGDAPYKTKFGTVRTAVPWARQSRSPVVARLRTTAEGGFALRQRVSGRLARYGVR